MNPGTKQHVLDRANASIRRGARQRYVAFPVLAALLGIGAYHFVPVSAPAGVRWAVVLLAAMLALLFILVGYRWSSLRLTPRGIEHESVDPMVRWSEIVAADYQPGLKLRLQNQFGRTIYLKLLYTSSPDDVIAAIRAHVSPGVPLKWADRSAPRNATAAVSAVPQDGFARTYGCLVVLYFLLPIYIATMALMDRQDLYHTKVIISVIYFGLLLAVQFWLTFWPCPHCDKPYFGGWKSPQNVHFSERSKWPCTNCGLLWTQGQNRTAPTS